MKIRILPVLICMLSACNQPSSSNQKQSTEDTPQRVSVFEPADKENPDHLKHIEYTGPS